VTGEVRVAQVFGGMRSQGDYFTPDYAYFLRTPADEVVSLGAFPQWPNLHTTMTVLNKLDINAANAGGLAGFEPSILYVTEIERVANDYCVIHRMKQPFIGELRNCGGKAGTIGTVAYGNGVLSWKDAMRGVCERVASDNGRKCQNNDVSPVSGLLVRDTSGNLSYIVATVRRLRARPDLATTPHSIPVDYDYFVYRVNPVGGRMTLLEHRDTPPDLRVWQRR